MPTSTARCCRRQAGIHWPLPDPAKATGTEEEITAEFRAVRDDIRARVEALLDRKLEAGQP
jgi:protein-tyrosine-phosphatase